MTQVEEMSDEDSKICFSASVTGIPDCRAEAAPQVVPIHYADNQHNLFMFTTEGKRPKLLKKIRRFVCRLFYKQDI